HFPVVLDVLDPREALEGEERRVPDERAFADPALDRRQDPLSYADRQIDGPVPQRLVIHLSHLVSPRGHRLQLSRDGPMKGSARGARRGVRSLSPRKGRSMRRGFLLGLAAAAGARALMHRLLLMQFERNVAALNAGDYRPLLANYAEDAVLHF